jgi:hypothetical protein
MSRLMEGEDFYFDDDGLMILTATYLRKRGHCCESGCLNCPYGFNEVVDPNIPRELQNPWKTQGNPDDSESF